MSPDSVRVKEEPRLEREQDSSSACARVSGAGGGQTECGASVQCVRVKEEPEAAQDRDSSEACPTEEEEADRECGVSAAAARAGLYAGHEVKGELVLGPELLQPPDRVFALRIASKNEETQESVKKQPARKTYEGQALRACSVRLQRLTIMKDNCNNKCKPFNQITSCGRLHSVSQVKTDTGIKRTALKNAQTPINKLQSTIKQVQSSHPEENLQLRLRPCSVRLDRLPDPRKQYPTNILNQNTSLCSLSADKTVNGVRKLKDLLYDCDVCKKQFRSKQYLIQHMKLHNASVTRSKVSTREDCKENRILTNRLQKNKSVKRDSQKSSPQMKEPYTCQICMKQFPTSTRLVLHVRVHTGEKPYKCDVCMKQFSSSTQLVVHMRSHTGEKPYKCDVCMKQFAYQSNYQDHKRVHTGEKPYKCDVCMKQFSSSTQLAVHMRVHTGEKPYKCDVCMKQFSQRSICVSHSRIHTGETPYKCELCMRQFARANSLNRHIRNHSREKPHKCDVCQSTFSALDALKCHKRIHSGEKPYKCDVCMKCFSRSYVLYNHMRIHTGEKPYKCEVCSKQFRTRNNLVVHNRFHSNEKRFTCDICMKQFVLKQNLYIHIQNHMKKKPRSR